MPYINPIFPTNANESKCTPTEYHQIYTQFSNRRHETNYTRNSFINPSPLSRTSYFIFGGKASYFALLIPIISSNSSSLRKYYCQCGPGRAGTSSFSMSTPKGRVSPWSSFIVYLSRSSISNAVSRSMTLPLGDLVGLNGQALLCG